MDFSGIQNQVVGSLIAVTIVALVKMIFSGKRNFQESENQTEPTSGIQSDLQASYTDSSIGSSGSKPGITKRILVWLFKLALKLSLAVGVAVFAAVYLDSELGLVQFGSRDVQEMVVATIGFVCFFIVWKVIPIKVFRR